ncbi:MAG: hypothetical protein ACE5ID_02365 [Acidobacteriota bacterium]
MDEMNEAKKEAQPKYIIEGARSGRSRCKACRRRIAKDSLRIGFFIQGPFGDGYLWHHLKCAARRFPERVEEAYAQSAWQAAQAPVKVPDLQTLQDEARQAASQRAERKSLPYAEIDPSGRARCKHCGQIIEKGSIRIALGRRIEFGSQVRVAPINVHPACVRDEMSDENCETQPSGFAGAIRANSAGLSQDQVEAALAVIGTMD